MLDRRGCENPIDWITTRRPRSGVIVALGAEKDNEFSVSGEVIGAQVPQGETPDAASESDVAPVGQVYVPAGEFQMGCDPDCNGGFPCLGHEMPLHTVHVDAFYIDITKMTNAAYATCVVAGACSPPGKNSLSLRMLYYDNPLFYEYPVGSVSWYAAANYCAWAGKRLPAEAEWEKAARGTTARAYPWGDRKPDCSLANFLDDNGSVLSACVGDTTQVGSYPSGASPYGVLDMAGNVSEWVSNWFVGAEYMEYERSPYVNPQGPDGSIVKVCRGAGFMTEVTKSA